MTEIRTQVWVHPLAGLATSRNGVVPPLIPPPPGHAATPLCPGDPAVLERHRPRIISLAQQEVQWIQIEGFVPPVDHLIDFDIVLLGVVDLWLRSVTEAPSTSQLWLRVHETVCPWLVTHPAREHLCNLFGKPATVGANWPNYSWGHSLVLDRLRKWHAAGYVQLQADHAVSPPMHVVAPRQRGVIRAVWLAQRLGLPLPPLLPEAHDRLVAASSHGAGSGPAPHR